MKNRALLINVACIVVILGGLKLASSVVMPFLLALFIAIVISPLINILHKFKVPKIVSLLLIIILFFGILTAFGSVIVEAIKGFSSDLPKLQNEAKIMLDKVIQKAALIGINLDYSTLGFDPNSVFSATGSLLKQTSGIAKTSFFVLLMAAFMLLESVNFKDKIAYLESQNFVSTQIIDNFAKNLKQYLFIKTLSSFVTGFLITIGLYILHVPYALLWGLMAFVLNYIPTIGSIVAAIPTIFVALAMNDIGVVLWVMGLYLVVNITIGNIIEPKFLGEGLDISPIVVLFSLLLWSYVFGIGGMFLAVPLTMSIQIALNSNPKTKFIAVMLGNKVKKKAENLA